MTAERVGRPRSATRPPSGTARAAALRLLSRRDYSAFEVRQKLEDQGFSADEVADTVSALSGERLIDDERVAQGYARVARDLECRGPLRIRRELEARGVAPGAIAAALGQWTADDEAAAIARVIGRKRVGRRDPAARRRLYQHLLRRGFSRDVIAATLGRPDEDG